MAKKIKKTIIHFYTQKWSLKINARILLFLELLHLTNTRVLITKNKILKTDSKDILMFI